MYGRTRQGAMPVLLPVSLATRRRSAGGEASGTVLPELWIDTNQGQWSVQSVLLVFEEKRHRAPAESAQATGAKELQQLQSTSTTKEAD
jgi:hypothetical protein